MLIMDFIVPEQSLCIVALYLFMVATVEGVGSLLPGTGGVILFGLWGLKTRRNG